MSLGRSLLALLAGAACSRPAPAAEVRATTSLEVRCQAPIPSLATMRRLATTREPVRVLVYGQSISSQDWWRETRNWMQTRYPEGNLIMEEHARGACPS